jgi:glycosyltransferase involved in cell wall biosynthesis
MQEPKISVIIPVYKVERYLPECLDSVLGQTYANLEILLVDDGSPDACGEICEEYARRDVRVRLIRQEHAGLSVARNTGLERAAGEYIGFVDSDDWIESDMYATLLRAALDAPGSIAVCGYTLWNKGRAIRFGTDTQMCCSVFQGLEALLGGAWFGNFAWNKLYHSSLFAGIRYPAGRNFEDIPVTYRLFERAARITLCPYTGYNYVKRKESIIGIKHVRNELDACLGHMERYIDLSARLPRFAPLMLRQFAAVCLHTVFISVQNTSAARREASVRRRDISAFIDAHWNEMLEHLKGADRMAMRLMRANRPTADWVIAICHAWRKIRAKLTSARTGGTSWAGHA